MEDDLPIRDGIVIPGSELSFTASRAGGPGGQHVNKTSSRVTLEWNVRDTSALDDEQRTRLMLRLRSRITRDGFIKVHVDSERSQSSNRKIARERLAQLIDAAFRVKKKRRTTIIPKAEKERRLNEKKKRSTAKHLRSRPEND
jgi:ribosome-associated protein